MRRSPYADPQYKQARLAVLEAAGWRCHWCGKRIAGRDATADHVKPLANGGGHHPDNLVACCRSCNSRRGNQLTRTRGKGIVRRSRNW